MEQDFLEILKVCNIVAFMFIKSVFLLLILQKLIKVNCTKFSDYLGFTIFETWTDYKNFM